MDEDTCSETTIGDDIHPDPPIPSDVELTLHEKTQSLGKSIDGLFNVPVTCSGQQVYGSKVLRLDDLQHANERSHLTSMVLICSPFPNQLALMESMK